MITSESFKQMPCQPTDGYYCTVRGKDDEEYESPKDEKCFRIDEIERHDYDKVHSVTRLDILQSLIVGKSPVPQSAKCSFRAKKGAIYGLK